MVFSSVIFLFFFLPAVLLVNLLPGNRLKNLALLLFSLGFYAWGEGRIVVIMVLSIVINYSCGLMIARTNKNSNSARAVLAIGVIANLAILCYFKYVNFFIQSFQEIGILSDVTWLDVALPIGISFFTFQGISYLIDVHRRDALYQPNPIDLGLYISLFPQLIAGPIIRYREVSEQITHRKLHRNQFFEGIIRFIKGFAKKMLIANNVALIADHTFSLPAVEVPIELAWLGIVCYTLQIYFDFSGYSDMAIGLGKMFGFNFIENFNYPYISKSIREFWRRWHISLSNWFRDYLYIPLGGNRKGSGRTYLNLLIVFFITGLWHGASWNFIVWGLYHGLFLLLERGLKFKLPSFLLHVYTILVVMVGWVFFKSPDLTYAMSYLSSMVGFSNGTAVVSLLFLTNYNIAIILIGIMLCIPWNYWSNTFKENTVTTGPVVFKLITYLFIFSLSILELAQNSYNPFIYYRF